MPGSRLLIGTHNLGKASEIARLLFGLDFQVVGAADWVPPLPAPHEVGRTFSENALLKARHYYSLTDCLTLADDSGLLVDALGGAPGVHSARYAGPGATPSELIAKLLEQLEGVALGKGTARFVCAIALIGSGIERVFEAESPGLITCKPQGAGGFGFDPVFLDISVGRTYAEMTREEKLSHSHRGLAFSAARQYLAQLRPTGDRSF